MKHNNLKFIIATMLLLPVSFVANAQSYLRSSSYGMDYVMKVQGAKVEVVDDNVVVSMHIVAMQDVPARQSIILVPELQDTLTNSFLTLPVIYINSRNQQIFYEREISRYITDAVAVRKYNGQNLQIDYLRTAPYEKWMESSVLKLRRLSCGCNVSSPRGEDFLCRLREPEPEIILNPQFRVPQAEAVKIRHKAGSAHINFHTDKWDILSDYMSNRSELDSIYRTINSVKNDPYSTINSMTIKGYASPEGNLEHNQMLSVNRTNALREHLQNFGIFSTNVDMTAYGNGENWDGYKEYLNNHPEVPQRATILNIINQSIPLDEKEAKIRREAPEGMRYSLDNIFPSLRCTNYEVTYTVRSFTVDEAEKVFEERPINLSLEEIYSLADKYKDNEQKYKAIMQKASLLYPNDPYVCLTMAYLAIMRKDVDDAMQYLQKVPNDWPEKQQNIQLINKIKESTNK